MSSNEVEIDYSNNYCFYDKCSEIIYQIDRVMLFQLTNA